MNTVRLTFVLHKFVLYRNFRIAEETLEQPFFQQLA